MYPLVVFFLSLSLYLSTLAPGMLRGDSGEFQWAMASLNVAHATGYPLFTLLGYAWQLVPLPVSVAYQLNLLAAFFGALAVTTLFVLVRSITRSIGAALAGAAFFALAPAIWFNASILEVYTLHSFLLALVLYLLLRWSQNPRDNRAIYLAFFIVGLGLAHHRMFALALPAIAVYILLTEPRFLLNVSRLLFCLLLLVPGLVLYLYVPLRLIPEGFSQAYALYDIILGREFQGSLLREIDPVRVLVSIPVGNFQMGAVVALLGGIALFQRARNLNVMLWLIYLVDSAFALIYSVPDVEVFLTSSFVVAAIWIGAGIAFVVEWVVARVGKPQAQWFSTPLLAVGLVAALLGLVRYDGVKAAVAGEAGTAEGRARAILTSGLPRGAFLELDWETATAVRFLQVTENARPDLEARLTAMDRRDEYWRALENVEAGRAVFVESGVKWTRAPAGLTVSPAGNDLARIERTSVTPLSLKLKINDSVELEGLTSNAAALTLYWRVQQRLDRDLATFVHYVDANGNKIAQDDRAPCCEAVYGYSTRNWEKDLLIADAFRPAPPQATQIEVGMYELVNGDIQAYGETLTVELQR